jgi:UDP-N-acetylmuramoyl-L-alanyl-D-glutamate--2,6-diaminopimelate ligase
MRRNLRGILTIGVTGTKGKTSTTEFIGQLLESFGLLTAVSTTESARIGSRNYEGFWSVPELHRFVALSKQSGADCVVIELCSSALRWQLHSAFSLDVAVLTNIGTDHIREHGNRRNYIASKQSMFRDLALTEGRVSPLAVLNADAPEAASFRSGLAPGVGVFTYGLQSGMRPLAGARHVAARSIRHHRRGTSFVVDAPGAGGLPCDTSLHGAFNVSNVLAAVTCAVALGCEPREVLRRVRSLVPPPGRFTLIATDSAADPTVVVDYAHTPESLASALEGARAYAPRSRVHVVFGCGGDAYKGKRPMMGAVAASIADAVTLTSDNPRTEDPRSIARDILRGMPPAVRPRIRVEPDRRAAIEASIAAAGPHDVVVIAGKGNERTQIVGTRVLPFSDVRVARRALDARSGTGLLRGRTLTAAAALVEDAGGAPLFSHHADAARAPASLAKLMTLYLAFEALRHGRVDLDTRVAISPYAALTPHPRLKCRAGERVRLGALLDAIAARSSNLAATAVAEHLANTELSFVRLMNRKATTLGLSATRFTTPHGLPHRHQITTARDMATLLARLLADHPESARRLRQPRFAFRGERHERQMPHVDRPFRLVAFKTGFTWEAGYNLVLAASAADRCRTVVVLGAASRRASFSEGRRLLLATADTLASLDYTRSAHSGTDESDAARLSARRSRGTQIR